MKRFNDILCVLDTDAPSAPVLERAVALAQGNRGRLTVVDVVEGFAIGAAIPEGTLAHAGLEATLVNERRSRLEALVAPYRERVVARVEVLSGVPFLEIVRAVLRDGHDLVVKAAEAHDWLERLFGGDDMHLLRKCPCPVWLIRAGSARPFRRILAAVDVGDGYPRAELAARAALNRLVAELAGSLALAERAELHVVHAWYPIGESVMRGALASAPQEEIVDYVEEVRVNSRRNLDALLDELGETLGREALASLTVRRHLVKGLARKEVPALAKRLAADLVVMGTVGRTGIPGFIMGNTAETMLNLIDCSVLAVKPPGFSTPVAPAD